MAESTLPAAVDAGDAASATRGPELVGWLAFAVGLAPHVGLKNVQSYAMFSNLHTGRGASNHLFVPASWQVFDYQKDLAEKKLSIMRLGQRVYDSNMDKEDLKGKKEQDSKNSSSAKKSGTALAVRDEKQSFLSQQSLNYF